jgi:hypothetical protein
MIFWMVPLGRERRWMMDDEADGGGGWWRMRMFLETKQRSASNTWGWTD